MCHTVSNSSVMLTRISNNRFQRHTVVFLSAVAHAFGLIVFSFPYKVFTDSFVFCYRGNNHLDQELGSSKAST